MVYYFNNNFFPKARRGSTYSEDFNFNHERGVAYESEGHFFASSLRNGGEIHFLTYGSRLPDLGIKKWIEKTFGDINPIESKNLLATGYKRIWRPVTSGSRPQDSREKSIESFVSLKIILRKLEELFETIEPSKINLQSFGHRVREVLLLACMEVESSWVAILKANDYSPEGKNFTTKDYVKLKDAMLLDGYNVHLNSYPAYPPFNPFLNWEINNPTGSLSWYDAYNKTKHDREANLIYATLENTVQAVGAAVVLYYAQFGFSLGLFPNDMRNQIIRNVFVTDTVNMINHEKEFYIPKSLLKKDNSGKVSCGFDPKWNTINFPFI